MQKVDLCRQLERDGDEATAIDCRLEIYETFGALDLMEPADREEFLGRLARSLDGRAKTSCERSFEEKQGDADAAARVWQDLLALYKESCGENRRPFCTNAWDRRGRDAMRAYVHALLRRYAVHGQRAHGALYRLSDLPAPLGYFDEDVLHLWERALCSCDDGELGECGEVSDFCHDQIASLCTGPECSILWCQFGTAVRRLEHVPFSLNVVLGDIEEHGACGPESGGDGT